MSLADFLDALQKIAAIIASIATTWEKIRSRPASQGGPERQPRDGLQGHERGTD